jgi:hypothetical protein
MSRVSTQALYPPNPTGRKKIGYQSASEKSHAPSCRDDFFSKSEEALEDSMVAGGVFVGCLAAGGVAKAEGGYRKEAGSAI